MFNSTNIAVNFLWLLYDPLLALRDTLLTFANARSGKMLVKSDAAIRVAHPLMFIFLELIVKRGPTLRVPRHYKKEYPDLEEFLRTNYYGNNLPSNLPNLIFLILYVCGSSWHAEMGKIAEDKKFSKSLQDQVLKEVRKEKRDFFCFNTDHFLSGWNRAINKFESKDSRDVVHKDYLQFLPRFESTIHAVDVPDDVSDGDPAIHTMSFEEVVESILPIKKPVENDREANWLTYLNTTVRERKLREFMTGALNSKRGENSIGIWRWSKELFSKDTKTFEATLGLRDVVEEPGEEAKQKALKLTKMTKRASLRNTTKRKTAPRSGSAAQKKKYKDEMKVADDSVDDTTSHELGRAMEETSRLFENAIQSAQATALVAVSTRKGQKGGQEGRLTLESALMKVEGTPQYCIHHGISYEFTKRLVLGYVYDYRDYFTRHGVAWESKTAGMKDDNYKREVPNENGKIELHKSILKIPEELQLTVVSTKEKETNSGAVAVKTKHYTDATKHIFSRPKTFQGLLTIPEKNKSVAEFMVKHFARKLTGHATTRESARKRCEEGTDSENEESDAAEKHAAKEPEADLVEDSNEDSDEDDNKSDEESDEEADEESDEDVSDSGNGEPPNKKQRTSNS
jgi:hypothetical protein